MHEDDKYEVLEKIGMLCAFPILLSVIVADQSMQAMARLESFVA